MTSQPRNPSLAQQTALYKAQREGPVITIAAVTADALIRLGYMRPASIDPPPRSGRAVSLTTKGLTWLANRERQ